MAEKPEAGSVHEAASFETFGGSAPGSEAPLTEPEETPEQEVSDEAPTEEIAVEAAGEEPEAEELDAPDAIVERVRSMSAPEAAAEEEPELARIRREKAVLEARLEEREKRVEQQVVGEEPETEEDPDSEISFSNPRVVDELRKLAQEDAGKYAAAVAEVQKAEQVRAAKRFKAQDDKIASFQTKGQEASLEQYVDTQIEQQAKALATYGDDYLTAVYRDYQKNGDNSYLGQQMKARRFAFKHDLATSRQTGQPSTFVVMMGSGIANLWRMADERRKNGDSAAGEEISEETTNVRGKSPRRIQKRTQARGEETVEDAIREEILGTDSASSIMPALR